MSEKKIESLYFKITGLWNMLCKKHAILFDFTCEEYMLLLSSDIDELEKKIVKKEEVIDSINNLEKVREQLINEINQTLPGGENKIKSISQLIAYCHQKIDSEKKENHLKKFNDLLIDIINKIQDQNKKNQLFLNKALSSLKEIREDVSGMKSYPLYTANGEPTAKGAIK
ncbi:MAG: flagellar export chaperone FlgN [Halobacteriovoraceae bacterium]|nr:flagellar export chaperone FlgN [Halobacteriovoraceae bacterium]